MKLVCPVPFHRATFARSSIHCCKHLLLLGNLPRSPSGAQKGGACRGGRPAPEGAAPLARRGWPRRAAGERPGARLDPGRARSLAAKVSRWYDGVSFHWVTGSREGIRSVPAFMHKRHPPAQDLQGPGPGRRKHRPGCRACKAAPRAPKPLRGVGGGKVCLYLLFQFIIASLF